MSLASSFAILSVQIFRRRASLAARTLRRQPSSVASAINNDNMRTLSKSADLISQPGDSVDDGCTPGFRGPAVIWSRLFFRDLTKKTKTNEQKRWNSAVHSFLGLLGNRHTNTNDDDRHSDSSRDQIHELLALKTSQQACSIQDAVFVGFVKRKHKDPLVFEPHICLKVRRVPAAPLSWLHGSLSSLV